jgi:hypothetical protein
MIRHVTEIVEQVGIQYKLDLLNEGLPAPSAWPTGANQLGLREYARRIWSLYTPMYGTAKTVGFSIECSTPVCTDRLNSMPYVYQTTSPPVFDLHIYDDIYNRYVQAWNTLTNAGYPQTWFIGETDYNNATTASALASARAVCQNTVWFVTQWPSDCTNGSCPVTAFVHGSPGLEHFGEYLSRGF